jgi:hypothetical protein
MVNQGTTRRQCLINVDAGMHDFNTYLLKFDQGCGYDNWSLRQPPNDRYGAIKHR